MFVYFWYKENAFDVETTVTVSIFRSRFLGAWYDQIINVDMCRRSFLWEISFSTMKQWELRRNLLCPVLFIFLLLFSIFRLSTVQMAFVSVYES